MIPKKYNPFHALIQRIAASKPGAWLMSRSLHHIDRIVMRFSSGRMSLTSILAGIPVVILTTTGAKSGLPRTVPLLGICDEYDPASFALIATSWGQEHYPAWFYNLRANPQATCSIAGESRQYTAHEATGEEYERFWQSAVDTYLGYSLYKQRIHGRKIPVIVMTQLKT